MWQINGFGSNDQMPEDFDENGFLQIPYSGLSGSHAGQLFFPMQPIMTQAEDANGEGYMATTFQPENAPYNEASFIPNQYVIEKSQVRHWDLPLLLDSSNSETVTLL